jgi:membrane dipeptidase
MIGSHYFKMSLLMLIFDAHLDMAWNACEWNRNLDLPVTKIREIEKQHGETVPGDCTVSWHELRTGGMGIVIATLLPRLHNRPTPLTFYQSREAAYAASMGQLAYYRRMVQSGLLRQISTAKELDEHIVEWKSNPVDTPIGFILSMEGSWSVLTPDHIHEWKANGLTILGPAHYGPDFYGHGTGSEGGFNADGKQLLKEMDSAGLLLDATHLSDQCMEEAFEIFEGPILASHHNCRTLVPGDRQLTDKQIKTLIDRGAVIGASFDNWMIKPGWQKYESDPLSVTMNNIIDHMDHICQIAGNANHCGIGTDLDGGFGREQSPGDIDTIADLPKMADLLRDRGYSDADVEGIMSGNWIRFFRQHL